MSWSAFPRATLPVLFLVSLSITGCQKEPETAPTPDPIPVTPAAGSAIVDIEADGSGMTVIEVCIEEPNGLVCGRRKGSKESFEATLPAPFAITEPASDAVFSLATDTITVKWEPFGEADIIEWSYSGKCSNGNWSAPGGKEDDTGELVIPAEGFSNLPADGCSVTIEIGRRRKGTVDASTNREGFISAAQVRTATFTVKP